jgi:hypothetical protein
LQAIKTDAANIENHSWRDQTYRELAKTLAFDGDVEQAISIIDLIQTPDTKAMTIRGIGMAVADNKMSKEQYDDIFKKLGAAAQKITDPPSHAIALTYIAMSQAFAGQNEEAWATAKAMENESLRHKAYGETAEIQAERGDFNSAMKSIGFIEAESYKNKAYATVSKILADGKLYNEALKAANNITNAYEKTSSMQYALDAQKPREVEKKK